MPSQLSKLTLLLGAFVVLSLLGVCSAQPETLSLSQVVSALDSSSPVLAQARAELTVAHAALTSSRALPNPALFGAQETLNDGDNSSERVVGVRQNLGFLWTQAPRTASARAAYESARAAFLEDRNAIIEQVIELAYDYDRYKSQSTLMDSVLFLSEQLSHATSVRRRVGDISPYDEQRFQLELVQLQNRRGELEREASSAMLELMHVTGLSSTLLSNLSLTSPPPAQFDTEEAAVQYALMHRPELSRTERQIVANKYSVAGTRWNQLPDLSIGVGRKSLDPGPDGFVVEAELEIPLWNQRRSDKSIARAGLIQAEVQHNNTVRSVEEEVRGAYRRLRLAERFQPASQVNYADSASTNMLRGVQLYAEGEISAFELVDALRTSVEAQDAVLMLRNALATARAELRRAVGLNPIEEN
ncbi:MAG: TolC family protein [Calditrichaeota bacterium]|nr:TolC family protein [Calditrichota bacterium]